MRKGTNNFVLLKDGRNKITDEQSIAQEMNLYFSSVFTHEQSDLPEFDNVMNDYMSHILCTPSEVEKHLKALNIHKSPWARFDLTPYFERMRARTVYFIVCIIQQVLLDWDVAS